jgi:DNA-binding MarR family transcriptional regulator
MREGSSGGKRASTPAGPSGPGDWVDRWEQTSTLELLRRFGRLSEQVAPAVARRAGLTHNELRALEHLMDPPMGPGELSRVLGVSSAAASGIIDRLETRGHAQRASHASDGRRTSVTISPSGRAEVLGFLMPMFRELAAVDAGLSDEERAVVDRYLEGAVRAVRAVV